MCNTEQKSVKSIEDGGKHVTSFSCREKLGEHDRFCVKCDSKRKAPTQSPPGNIKRTKTLDDFIKQKGKERHGFPKQKEIRYSSGIAACPRISKVKVSSNIRLETLINACLFKSNNEGDIFPKRGSRIPVKIGKQ